MRTFHAFWLVLLGFALVAGPARGQAIPPGVTADHPLPSVSTGLDLLRNGRVVAYLHRPATLPADQDRSPYEPIEVRRNNAVLAWEYVMLGLSLPYKVVDDAELARGMPDDVRVLILPGSEMLSAKEMDAVKRFVERGGGLIAQGRTGLFDERATRRDARFFNEVFGAEFVENVPEQPGGLFQQLDGSHALTAGIEPGYLLNLTAQTPTSVARAVRSQALGKLVPYNAVDNEVFRPMTMALYGETGGGRFVWTRFLPQDVSREVDQQRHYVTFLINALAYITRVPVAGVRPWPNAALSATAVSLTPLVGGRREFRPSMNRLFDAFEAAGIRPSVFLTADEAKVFPDVAQRVARTGELAAASRDDEVLRYAPLDQQIASVQAAVDEVGKFGKVEGFHPPAGYFDHNTIRAMESAGLGYLLRFLPHPSLAPAPLTLGEDADFRETVTGNLIDIDTLRVIGNVGVSAPGARGVPSTAIRVNQTTEGVNPPSTGPQLREPYQPGGAGRPQLAPTSAYDPRVAPVRARPVGSTPDTLITAGTGRGRLTQIVRQRDAARTAMRQGQVADPTTVYVPPSTVPMAGTSYPVQTAPMPGNKNDVRPDVTRPEARGISESVGLYERNERGYRSELDEARMLVMGIWGRDDYEVTSNLERASRTDLQLAAFRADFLDAHDARGLYILPLHAEIQGLTDERAQVAVQLVQGAQAEGSWLTTLGALRTWWFERNALLVTLTNVSTSGADLDVVNRSAAPIQGASVDLFLNDLVAGRSARVSGGANLVRPEDDTRLTLVFPNLPAGSTRVHLSW